MPGYIGNLATVNGGKIVNWGDFSAEIMGKGYSTHPDNLVAVYAREGGIKVELVYNGKDKTFTIFRFKGYDDLQHYWSTNKSKDYILNSPTYKRMGKACIKAYNDIFNKSK